MPATTPSAARSGSTSGKTTAGFFPPSSRVTCFTATPAADRWMARPVDTEPMSASRFTRGARTSASPASAPVPLMMLKTPGGSRSRATSPSVSTDSGQVSGGLTTTALPATSAAVVRATENRAGWLYAAIRPTTP